MLIEEGYDSSLWIPCYVAPRHGWNVSSFHELCDNMAPTLTIVRKDNYLFGGFTEKSWEGKSIAQNVIVFLRRVASGVKFAAGGTNRTFYGYGLSNLASE